MTKLGELDVRDVPGELVHLRAIADCIHNALVSMDQPERNREKALWLIEFIEDNLSDAKNLVSRRGKR